MKIAIIGAKGFVGSRISKYLELNHSVYPITRDNLDVLNPLSVKYFLSLNSFDVIINCAATMTDNNQLYDARNNFGMFINFYDNRHKFGKFINMASGAEFDRTTNIDNANELDIFHIMPSDSYGWGQNMKARICATTDKFYNIRIFNCFGRGEIPTRIFPRFLRESFITITDDRYFDYFSIQDLVVIVKNCVENDWKEKDVNAVYEGKIKISQALELFCKINNLKPNFKVINNSNKNYTGNHEKLKSLKIKLGGLEQGFKDYFE